MFSISAIEKWVPALVLCVILTSCSKTNTPTGILTPSGNALRGTVVLHDEFRNKVNDCSTVLVSVTNGKSTYTDTATTEGEWEIGDIPAGIYTITATALGFNGLVLSDIDTYSGIQYAGSDVLEIPEFRLGKELDSSFFSNGTIEVTWKYRYDSDDTTKVVDSTAWVLLTFETKNSNWDGYEVTLCESPDAPCSERLAISGVAIPSLIGQTVIWSANDVYGKVRSKFGDNRPPLLYFLVRPSWTKRASRLGPEIRQCSMPLIIPVQF